jgi:adenine-specific DNA-methyltransferase
MVAAPTIATPALLPPLVQRISASLAESARVRFAVSFAAAVVKQFWRNHEIGKSFELNIPFHLDRLDPEAAWLAENYANSLGNCDCTEAGYRIGIAYTSALPPTVRSERGVFYTPPALCDRLIRSVTRQGLNWTTARVLDGSCGGAAFLAPVALQMRKHLRGRSAKAMLASICGRLHGFEVDSFAAWLSQVLVEIALADLCIRADERLPAIVTVQDSLTARVNERFDLVIGNPPYGRCSLDSEMRKRYARSLYGHANMYGLFTDAALRWASENGLIAYVTPTSMLGGEYFRALRCLLAREAPLVSIDFIEQRAGVFESVLQETMLAVYRKGTSRRSVFVHFLDFRDEASCRVLRGGRYEILSGAREPWLLPRSIGHCALVHRLAEMPTRLSDYGYGVSTGPLVWNRHKPQFRHKQEKGAYPVIWAEAVSSAGRFAWRADKVNHEPWFLPREKDQWVISRRGCVLVQRTTAKEQKRRLIAAELPESFVAQHRGVIVENHLNMVRAIVPNPSTSSATIAVLLNSDLVDAAFRCINGSVAVSAFELEALPLPSVEQMRSLEAFIARGATKQEIEAELTRIYFQGQGEHVTTGIA